MSVLDALRRLARKELAMLNPEEPYIIKEPETTAEMPTRPLGPTTRQEWESIVVEDLDQHSSLWCNICHVARCGCSSPACLKGWTDPRVHQH